MNTIKHSVNQMEQNKVSLIVADLIKYGIPEDIAYNILLNRGVFKWLAVRRDLIKLKNCWKEDIKKLEQLQKIYKANKLWKKYLICKGEKKMLIECRKQIRKLCHSERCRIADNDNKARVWLNRKLAEEGEK